MKIKNVKTIEYNKRDKKFNNVYIKKIYKSDNMDRIEICARLGNTICQCTFYDFL